MNLYFGIVKKYLPEKGFGFLTHPIFWTPNKDIFFHITNVKRSNKILAERLSTYDVNDNICFWYISETSQKGEQLQRILKPQDAFKLHQNNSSDFKEKIELIWRSIEEPIPFWLSDVTIGQLGLNRHDELKSERETLIQKRNEEREEQERLRKISEEKARVEQEEFELLVAEMESKGFTTSAQVSHYIIKNRLGDKYQNISGVLEMEKNSSSWKFNGGFPPRIYAMLCARLNLNNKGTASRVIGFTSFKDLK